MADKTLILVIAVGNGFRSDDCVGLHVARKIKEMKLAGVKVIEQQSAGPALMDIRENTENVFIIDAVKSGAAPGTIFRFDAITENIPSHYFSSCSTHSLGVADSIKLLKALGKLPPSLIIYGIEGKDFSAGKGLTPQVAKSVRDVANRIRDEIDAALSGFSIRSDHRPTAFE